MNKIKPEYYNNYPISPIEFIHQNGLFFIEGCVIKYVCRHRDKGGADDIKKAIEYLQLLLEKEYPESLDIKPVED